MCEKEGVKDITQKYKKLLIKNSSNLPLQKTVNQQYLTDRDKQFCQNFNGRVGHFVVG
jgi:hypothetical protein